MSLATAAAGAVLRPWVLPAAGIALAGLLAALAVQSYRVNSYRSEAATVRAEWAEARADAFKAGQAFEQDNARRLEQVNTSLGKTLDEERSKSAQAAADAGAAAGAADRLRQHAAALAARCPAVPAPAGPAGSGPSARAPGDLLAELLGRSEARADQLAGIAERALIAAETCEAFGDEGLEALRGAATPSPPRWR